jgi:glycosyltransferase involved in cell wall biosynthesis
VNRIRVLHAIQNLNYGGMERLFADIVERLDPARFESHVYVLGYLGRFGEGLERFATIHHAPEQSRLSLLRPAALARSIATIAPDLVHSHAGVWYKMARAARMAGVQRVVHTEHGRPRPDPWIHRLVGRMAARKTDTIVAVSDVLADYLRREGISGATPVVTIPNGVDIEAFAPRPAMDTIRHELGIPREAPVVGSIGRLEQIKGYDVMVRAFGLLLQGWRKRAAPILLLVGDGSERPRLEALVAELGITRQVRMPGWRDDIHELHATFSIFAMSSRSEGTSVSLLEAMSAGLCPVVTAVGGNAAVLGTSLAHRLVPTEDPVAFCDSLRAVLADVEASQRDGAIARSRVQERFSLEAMLAGYEALYTQGAPAKV